MSVCCEIHRMEAQAKRFATVCLMASAISLTACADQDFVTISAFDDERLPEIQQGFFRGGNVAGLEFTSAEQSGVTDSSGAYTCRTGSTVTFAVGSVSLGETECGSLAHAAAMTASGSPTDPAALNITRFLMLLDQDDDPGNGIFISESLRSLADSWTQIDFSASDFEGELSAVLADITSAESRIASVPDSAEAFVLLDAGLSCAYAGVYINLFPAGAISAPTSVALNIFKDPVTNVVVGDFLLLRQDPTSQVFLASTAEVMLGTLPGISNSAFFADFISPDRLTGSWLTAAAQQTIDRTGTFIIFRIGEVSGDYRFAGKLEKVGELSTDPSLQSRIALSLDGDAITGEAFDTFLGVRLGVTGRRLPNSNDYEIEVDGLGRATGSFIVDANDEPIAIEGNWPGYDENVLEGVGCRLI